VDESAGVSSADLTLGSDVGKIHVDTQGDTSTMTLAADLGEIKVVSGDAEYTISLTGTKVTIEIVPSSGDPQSITMDGAEIIIDGGPTPTEGGIKIGGTGGEQALVTKA
jgi:hypothetical protein